MRDVRVMCLGKFVAMMMVITKLIYFVHFIVLTQLDLQQ